MGNYFIVDLSLKMVVSNEQYKRALYTILDPHNTITYLSFMFMLMLKYAESFSLVAQHQAPVC